MRTREAMMCITHASGVRRIFSLSPTFGRLTDILTDEHSHTSIPVSNNELDFMVVVRG